MRRISGLELVERPKLDDDGNPILDGGEPVLETVSPIPDGDRLAVSEAEGTRFGQLEAADLSSYRNAVDVLLQQIMAASALPEHMVGVTSSNPASADAIRSAEAGLTSRAAARQGVFGKSWEPFGRLAVRDGVDPADVDCRITWCDPATRSVAQEADAVVKLHQSGILSREGALRRLNFSDDEVRDELTRKANEVQNESEMGVFYGRQTDLRGTNE